MESKNLTKLLRQYYEAKQNLAEAEGIVKDLSTALTDALMEQEGHRADIPEARFILRMNPTYKFSKKVEIQEEKLSLQKEIIKSLKDAEIAEGVAEVISERFTPVMMPVKEK